MKVAAILRADPPFNQASLWSEPDRGGPQQNILDTNCHDLDLNQYASQSIISADELYTDGISTASTILAQRKPLLPMPAIYMGTSNSTFRTFQRMYSDFISHFIVFPNAVDQFCVPLVYM